MCERWWGLPCLIACRCCCVKYGGVIGCAIKGQDVGCHGEDVELTGGDEDGAAGGWVDEALSTDVEGFVWSS